MNFKESETLELKKTTAELKQALESISAILNKHQKGELYFGIRNDGVVVGMDISDKTLRDVSHSISENIEPKIIATVSEEVIKGQHFIVTFKRKAVVKPDELVEKVGDRVGEKVGVKVGKNELRIIQLIADNITISYSELAERLRISEKSVFKNIKKLKEKGLLKRIGSAKGGHWEVRGHSDAKTT